MHPAPRARRPAVRTGDAARLARQGLEALSRLARTVTAADPRPGMRRLSAEARSLAIPYSRDEREAFALLLLPFLIVASAIVLHQSMRAVQSYVAAIAMPEDEIVPVRSRVVGDALPAPTPRSVVRASDAGGETVAAVAAGPAVRSAGASAIALEAVPPEIAARPIATPESRPAPHSDIAVVKAAPYPPTVETDAGAKLAFLTPVDEMRRGVRPVSPEAIEAFEADARGRPLNAGICAIDEKRRTTVLASGGDVASLDGAAFGLRLAKAAEAQVDGFVIYNDAYRRLTYPMGDVHDLYGVCTDVVVRAYRALGVDLQALVHRARAGTGDASIDHRRTEVLRRFFSAHGESLPMTSFAEDYRPGDIVTYYRPQNRGTRAHIAIVSSVLAPSGRPMIVHNRGWGPQLEDALFVDEITGHYRYRGPTPSQSAETGAEHGLPAAADVEAPVLPASLRASRLPPAQRQY